MPRRKELKDVANGIVTSFISRNNDLSGYWGIGMLCRAALEKGDSFVTIDLLTAQTSLITREFDPIIKHYRDMLQRLMVNRSIPSSWIKNASLMTSFNQENDKRYHYFQSALGPPYICKITIIDDRGKEYIATVGGHCKPHDPRIESRRAPNMRII